MNGELSSGLPALITSGNRILHTENNPPVLPSMRVQHHPATIQRERTGVAAV